MRDAKSLPERVENIPHTNVFPTGVNQSLKVKVEDETMWKEALAERRCDSQGRGSVYDSKVGELLCFRSHIREGAPQ